MRRMRRRGEAGHEDDHATFRRFTDLDNTSIFEDDFMDYFGLVIDDSMAWSTIYGIRSHSTMTHAYIWSRSWVNGTTLTREVEP